MRALITGGAGFIGSHLSEELLSRGQEVICLDDLSTGSLANIARLQDAPGFSFREGSVLEGCDLSSSMERVDVVYHLAAAVGVKYVLEHPTSSLVTNARGTERVLSMASEKGGPKVVLASSSEVYGKSSKLPFREDADTTLGATSISRWGYACAKTFDEFLALAYHQEHGLPVVALRYFNTVGPRQASRYGMVMPRFVSQALSGQPITVYGDGEQIRSFTYVKDVVKATADIAEVPSASGQVFNVGTNNETTVNQLADLVRRTLDSNSEIVHIPFSEVYGEGFEESRRRSADISKIRRYIDYSPTSDLAAIIVEMAGQLSTAMGDR